MEHLAILAKKWKLLAKILSGEKTIESRWYKSKKTPYHNISTNDIVYFKESGDSVAAKARVSKVLFFDDLDKEKILDILRIYGKAICAPLSYADKLTGKKYCTLVFIDDVKQIEPFDIDKTGHGLMAAWISVDDICSMKR